MPVCLSAVDFLELDFPLLDTRSPGEFAEGHIPRAIPFPLFDNDQRAAIGTCYKRRGHDAAVELGLEIVAPKMIHLVRQAKTIAPDRRVAVHCWRGGMRSSSMAWLLETAGFEVYLLEGGYKAYRKWVRERIEIQRPIITLGGLTGTGKTMLLLALGELGESILDLEGWANHRGSTYGAIGLPKQPTQEQFENLLAHAWDNLPLDQAVWIESESEKIGRNMVPKALFLRMIDAPVVQIERSLSERVEILQDVYGDCDPALLVEATQRIVKRLGGQHAQQAIERIQAGDLGPAIEITLVYYDKTYNRELEMRSGAVHTVNVTGLTAAQAAAKLQAFARQNISHDTAANR